MFDPNHPTRAIRGVPGYAGDSAAEVAYGAVSAEYWAKSFGSTVAKHEWSWPTPDSFDGAEQVPYLRGYSEERAIERIKDAGFKPVAYPIKCGSGGVPGNVAYYGPQYAKAGQDVYYCLSNGKPLTTAPKPKPKPKPDPTKTTPTPAPTKPTTKVTPLPGQGTTPKKKKIKPIH